MADRKRRGPASVSNREIAEALENVGRLLDIQGANTFRVRAYENAAQSVHAHPTALEKMVAEGADLTELPGIGKDMAGHIAEMVRTGRLRRLDELAEEVPITLLELLRLPSTGPKSVRRLWQELGVSTVDDLEKAAREGRVAALKGFGEKKQQQILAGIESLRRRSGRFKLSDADALIVPLLAHMEEAPGIRKLEVAGSYRRRRETIGDIDLLAVASKPGPVMEHFAAYPGVKEVRQAGETRSSVVLANARQVDLRIVPAKSFGAALVYFTGSKSHNIVLRTRAGKGALRVSEYGVFREADAKDEGAGRDPWAGEWIAGRTEKDVYASLDLAFIPPEMREDRGEIEAAERGKLPKLIERRDLRGDLQMHSTWSDGRDSIEKMMAACAERGYEYLAVTDHGKALPMVRGLDAKRLREQWDEMERLQDAHPEIRLLRSMEVDILEDGTLDLEDALLEKLDVVLVSIHSRFDLPVARQTERVLRALRHPRVHILGHPTSRRISGRDGIAIDLDAVLACAAENRVALECNSQPDRLDLRDTHLIEARKRGLKIVISTDAHSAEDLDLIRYGIDQARRAWLTRGDVLNTLPAAKLLASLEK